MDTLLAEQSVIGCMLLFPADTTFVYQRLGAKMFSESVLQNIFAACRKLHKQNKKADVVTVGSMLGNEYQKILLDCCNIAPSLAGLPDYVAIVLEGWRVRELTAAALDIQLDGGTSDELIAKYRAVLERQEAVNAAIKDAGTKDFVKAATEYLTLLNRPNTAIKTGWQDFDRIVGGLPRKSVVVISARPGKGKTDFALQIAQQVALDYHVNYNSMEMPVPQLMERIVSRTLKINSIRLRDKKLDDKEKNRIAHLLDLEAKHLKINFDETPQIDAETIENKIARYHPDVLFIDHLGLMGTKESKKNQWEAVAQTTHALKALAMKHDLCIVELVQLGRATDGRKATQGDLYGGAAVEQDADIVITLEVAPFEGFLSGDQCAEVTATIQKNRHGGTGTLKFGWQPQYHDYRPYETRYTEE